MLEAGELTD